jgi:uncharacterized protein
MQVFGPHGFEWNRHELAIEDLPRQLNGLRMIHLSDLHLRPHWTAAYDRFIHRLAEDPPDLLLITGDFVETKRNQLPVLPTVRRLLGRLSARHGIFAITGNHDGDLLAPHLSALNVAFIDGQSLTLRPGTSPCRLELIGLPGPYRHDFDPAFLRRIPPRVCGVPRIVLSHYPDLYRQTQPLNADLFLAGHTHGGQVCLPGGRALITHDALPKHLCKGVHRFGRTHLVINRGFGFASIPLRLFCPAEVIEIILTS